MNYLYMFTIILSTNVLNLAHFMAYVSQILLNYYIKNHVFLIYSGTDERTTK